MNKACVKVGGCTSAYRSHLGKAAFTSARQTAAYLSQQPIVHLEMFVTRILKVPAMHPKKILCWVVEVVRVHHPVVIWTNMRKKWMMRMTERRIKVWTLKSLGTNSVEGQTGKEYTQMTTKGKEMLKFLLFFTPPLKSNANPVVGLLWQIFNGKNGLLPGRALEGYLCPVAEVPHLSG